MCLSSGPAGLCAMQVYNNNKVIIIIMMMIKTMIIITMMMIMTMIIITMMVMMIIIIIIIIITSNVIIILSALVNVALGRRTFMSHPYKAGGSSLAVDGNRNSSVEVVGSCSVTHSPDRIKSWWAVDLGVVANVTSVAISQRDKKGKIYLLGKLRSLFSVM